MILDKQGQKWSDTTLSITIGDGIYAIGSDFAGLYGIVTEIRDDEDKDTGNDTTDIYCRFFRPFIHKVKLDLEERWSEKMSRQVLFDEIAIDKAIMSPQMLRKTKQCRIYQVCDMGSGFFHCSYEKMIAKNSPAPPGNIYQIVYDNVQKTDNLEEIFYLFNCCHPYDFQGRSMSVSDIIEVIDNDDHTFYYCDTFGFVEIPFVPDSTTRQGNTSY